MIEQKKDNNNFKITLVNTKDNIEFIQFLDNNKSINLNMIDKINNFYVTIIYNNIKVEIPFNYIMINTNKKLNGIPYINFEYLFCSSKKLGYCNIQDSCCYSIRDQNLFKQNYYKIKLNVLFFDIVQNNLFKGDKKLFNKVVEYLEQFKVIRFNCNNDIKTYKNIEFLKELALNLKNSVISGYTNRLDLIKDKTDLEKLELPSNLIINGSNYMLTNNYITTTDLKTFVNAKIICLGSCLNCLNCFKLKNKKIYCLLHGSLTTIDKYYNTKDNRLFLINFFNTNFNYLNLTELDLKQNKGLLSSLNKFFKNHKLYYDWKFNNYNELVNYIVVMIGSVNHE